MTQCDGEESFNKTYYVTLYKGDWKMLTAEDRKRINEIVCNLIVKNMKAGLSYKKAKTATFNRMELECPEVLRAWLNR